MKTHVEILERYLSPESVDFFGAQRKALLGMLPFDMAKPYLEPTYVKNHEDGTVPEEEKWIEGFDINQQILDVLPEIYKAMYAGSLPLVSEGLLYLKSWIWSVDEEFHDKIAPQYDENLFDDGKELLDNIAKHFNYSPVIEDVEFEEIPNEGSDPISQKED